MTFRDDSCVEGELIHSIVPKNDQTGRTLILQIGFLGLTNFIRRVNLNDASGFRHLSAI